MALRLFGREPRLHTPIGRALAGRRCPSLLLCALTRSVFTAPVASCTALPSRLARPSLKLNEAPSMAAPFPRGPFDASAVLGLPLPHRPRYLAIMPPSPSSPSLHESLPSRVSPKEQSSTDFPCESSRPSLSLKRRWRHLELDLYLLEAPPACGCSRLILCTSLRSCGWRGCSVTTVPDELFTYATLAPPLLIFLQPSGRGASTPCSAIHSSPGSCSGSIPSSSATLPTSAAPAASSPSIVATFLCAFLDSSGSITFWWGRSCFCSWTCCWDLLPLCLPAFPDVECPFPAAAVALSCFFFGVPSAESSSSCSFWRLARPPDFLWAEALFIISRKWSSMG
mmetsp:Transcript_14063/g.39848  ORF Transcript_14063/g.39848 Transcript_14063/m.39848 type:complete len:339 (-) Transcript_14063:613-1629(-)